MTYSERCIIELLEERERLRKAVVEARDILESVAVARGFVVPFKAKEWLKNYAGIEAVEKEEK